MDQFSGGQGAFHFRSSALGPELRSVRLTSAPHSQHRPAFSSMFCFIDCDAINVLDLPPFLNDLPEPAEVHRQLCPPVLPCRAGRPDFLFGQHLGGR